MRVCVIHNVWLDRTDESYGNATALVITFTVNNFKNDKFQKMALTWEKAFLELMANFSGKSIIVDYSAEVSSLCIESLLCRFCRECEIFIAVFFVAVE